MKLMQRNRSRKYSIPVVMILVLIFSGSFIVAQETDFSGEWILNESESDMGDGMRRVTKAIKVNQEGNNFELEKTRTGRDGQEMTSTEKLTLDGETSVNSQGNRSSESSVTWSEDGKSITISSVWNQNSKNIT